MAATGVIQIDWSERHDELKHILNRYRNEAENNYDCLIPVSGGKDSTCMAQLVWNAIVQLPEEKRSKKIYIIGCDTLVESPKIVERLKNTLSDMQGEA